MTIVAVIFSLILILYSLYWIIKDPGYNDDVITKKNNEPSPTLDDESTV